MIGSGTLLPLLLLLLLLLLLPLRTSAYWRCLAQRWQRWRPQAGSSPCRAML
jgi:hypothetical protein